MIVAESLVGCLLGFGAILAVGPPSDDLLKRVPEGAAIVVAVDGLRANAPKVLGSPIVKGLMALPAVRKWMAEGGEDRVRASLGELEKALGLSFEELRDEVFGDAVVLSFSLEGPAREPVGLLMVRPRDLGPARRTVEAINRAEGDALALEEKRSPKRGRPYVLRRFKGDRPPDAYAFDTAVMAWSSSPWALERALDEGPGEGPKVVRAMKGKLSDRAIVRAYLDPEAVAPLLAAESKDDPSAQELGRLMAPVEAVGASLEWRDGPVLEVVEAIDPKGWDQRLASWAKRPGDAAALRKRVPERALAVAALHVDLAEAARVLLELVPDAERPKVEAALMVARGTLNDRDLLQDVLPKLGPGALGFLDLPKRGEDAIPFVGLLTLEDEAVTGRAIANALRTFFALVALSGNPTPKLETKEFDGIEVTSLLAPGGTFAFAIGHGLLAVGNSPWRVADALRPRPERAGSTRFERFRAIHFPKADSFLYADLEEIATLANSAKDQWPQWLGVEGKAADEAQVADFAQAVEAIGLFRGAYLSMKVSEDLKTARFSLGLVGK